jgi:hypothetical protein
MGITPNDYNQHNQQQQLMRNSILKKNLQFHNDIEGADDGD